MRFHDENSFYDILRIFHTNFTLGLTFLIPIAYGLIGISLKIKLNVSMYFFDGEIKGLNRNYMSG